MSRVCIKGRICKECGKEFAGDRYTCPQCRYKNVKASCKFARKYHHDYYHKFLKVDSNPRETKGDVKDELRREALARHTERIHGEMAAIIAARLSPTESTVAAIIDAGVALDGSLPSLPCSRPVNDARRIPILLRSLQDCGLAG